tara:strand:- start:141 stop:500 length:360 start_codon:yes stop_codon:yes gene_type:complete
MKSGQGDLFNLNRIVIVFLFFIISSCTSKLDLCSVSEISYIKHIKPLIKGKCISCHNNNFAYGNLNLQDYEVLTSPKVNKQIIEVIKLEIGDPNLMPPNRPLDECQIKLLENWLNLKNK